ncbi:MAG: hypothetical protein KF696_02640 [Planctomycetes bacterium]|nr:hypothetical protein [Planctomycetota bacterium]MCW8134901.1 hypothetical protein [Planctomycetota bacterium]
MRACTAAYAAAVFLFAAPFLAPLSAGLLDSFGGKSEADIAADFEAAMPKFLEGKVAEGEPDRKARMHYTPRGTKTELFVQCIEVKGEKSRWQDLVTTQSWYPDRLEYMLAPHGAIHEVETLKLPAECVAGWYSMRNGQTVQDMIALAVWAAQRNELMVANAVLAGVAQRQQDRRADIEAWLCTKLGWSAPKDGLLLVETHDLEHNIDGALLLTPQAAADRIKNLEKEAGEALKQLELMQGGDVKSKPGRRRGAKGPSMRLDQLANYCERYKKAYAGTKFIEGKKNLEKLEKIIETVKADLDYVNTEKFKAERLGIDNDLKGCADAWIRLKEIDPYNPEVLVKAGEACSKAAVITDGARKAENPDYAYWAAQTYDDLIRLFPLQIAYYNHAGVNWLAASSGKYSDGKKNAKQRHEHVVKTIEAKPADQRVENDTKNLEFAKRQLDLIK